LRYKVISFLFEISSDDNAFAKATPMVINSMMIQGYSLMLMGANLIFNGVIIWKYKIKLHNAFTRYDSSQMTTAR
jgi:hypothetical protein